MSKQIKHIGENECVTGRVIRVETGSRGVHYLDFCEDYRLCPFSVVVFPYDLKKVGDVRQLAGRVVEVRGELKEYDGRAEIVLEDGKQLGARRAFQCRTITGSTPTQHACEEGASDSAC